jgi:hypothetical protein
VYTTFNILLFLQFPGLELSSTSLHVNSLVYYPWPRSLRTDRSTLDQIEIIVKNNNFFLSSLFILLSRPL